jgi:hypothetical protein
MEYFVLDSSIHTVMQVEEGREFSGAQSRQYKLGKHDICQYVRPAGEGKMHLNF